MKYEKPSMEIIELKNNDVITSSGKLNVSTTPGGGGVDQDYSEIF